LNLGATFNVGYVLLGWSSSGVPVHFRSLGSWMAHKLEEQQFVHSLILMFPDKRFFTKLWELGCIQYIIVIQM